MADDHNSDIATFVKRARAAKGLSQPQLARRVGTSQQTIDKIESGRVKHSSFMAAIARELGIPLDKVLRISHNGGTNTAITGHELVGEQRDLPVYAATQGGIGVQILSSDPVEYVSRPEPLARVRDGYGVIVVDDSMAPEFRSGDIALINPHLPPRTGDTCIFRHVEEDGTQHSCIKFLRRITDRDWLVSEWDAATEHGGKRDFALKRAEWQLAHVVVGSYKRR
jgi:transcriptional regulator with XRE-family HTH domain